MSTVDEVFDRTFPAPEPRDYQDKVVKQTVKTLAGGTDVVAIDAPPGFGKSITLWTIVKMLDASAFYTTPLKSLQDQLVEDYFVGDTLESIKGRANYYCIHPDADSETTVDRGPCQKEDNFDCELYNECPYYAQKHAAIENDIAVMNMSYLMAEGMVDPMAEGSFGNRDILIIDECQSIEDWAINFIGFTISKFTIPDIVYKNLDIPDEEDAEDVEYIAEWLKNDVLPEVVNTAEMYSAKTRRSNKELNIIERLSEFETKVRRFLMDYEDNHWVSTYDHVIRKNRDNYTKINLKPIIVGRFLDSLLWDRGNKFILSSATIPENSWFDEIGLSSYNIVRVPVPSPFPVDNRPIITEHAVGKMTKSMREDNMPEAVGKVKAISEHHEGDKGIIHARAYGLADLFRRTAVNNNNGRWFNEKVEIQDRENREQSLENWVEGDKQIFLSVNMAEGIDLKYDKCRWQVLLKTLYPHLGDKRVQYRVNTMEDWPWYNRHAITQIEQSYGRAVRAPDDWAIFYIIDGSAKGLIQRSAEMFHKWFLEGITDLRIDVGRGI